MSVNAIMLRPIDNVVTVVGDVKAGDTVNYVMDGKNESVVAKEDIPAFHKISVKPIKNGEHIIKYGQIIGGIVVDAEAGQWISHKNIISLPRNYEDEL
ncbi:UxaA family hydrolase [Anaerotignum faecicola]|nr:UxaA family hydrolase [Anaerotignum faecicola]